MRCDPRAFARCPYNKTCASPEQSEFLEGSDCYLFNQKVLERPLTEADHIRQMSDVELSMFLYEVTRCCADKNCAACPIGEQNCIVMLYWLRQPKRELSKAGH